MVIETGRATIYDKKKVNTVTHASIHFSDESTVSPLFFSAKSNRLGPSLPTFSNFSQIAKGRLTDFP